MAIIVGLEEKERILKSIEEKIKEVEELNAFLAGLENDTSTVILTCVDQGKKRYRIHVKGNLSSIAAFVKEQRENLCTEITVLCKANTIALNETERQILGITEKPDYETEPYPEDLQEAESEAYEAADLYEEGGYSNE